MSSNFEFNAPHSGEEILKVFREIDDTDADNFFNVQTKQEEQKTLLVYSPDVGVSNKKEMTISESNLENKDPSNYMKTPATVIKNKKDSPILRKVLNELKIQHIQHESRNTEDNVPTSEECPKDLLQQLEKLQIGEIKPGKSKVRANDQNVQKVRATQLFEGIVLEKPEVKPHRMTTRLDSVLKTPVLKLRSRSVPKPLDNSDSSETDHAPVISDQTVTSTGIVHNRFTAVKRNASPLNSTRKFMSLAEQVQHFHKDTPDRFRSKPKTLQYRPESIVPRQSCIPKTPNLTTKYRSRPVHFPNEKEREEMELEEIKKHQIKAYPLNEKILKGPCLNLKTVIEKKPKTVPEPFQLTEVKKKEVPQPEVFTFKAQPVPSSILKHPVGIPPKKVLKPTTPHTPHMKIPMRFRVEAKQGSISDQSTCSELMSPPRNTKVQPFSFDERMKEMLRRKEETIRKIIDEEKKSFNSFKAHPVPSYRGKLNKSVQQEKEVHHVEPKPFNLTQPKERKPVEEPKPIRTTPFKAQPATVVHKKPFVPKLPKHELATPEEFHLNTEKRALERQKFDEMIKKREEEHAELLKKRQEEEERLERIQYLEDRKKAEFKATPVPRHKTFEIHGADPSKLTMPHSPLFSNKIKQLKGN